MIYIYIIKNIYGSYIIEKYIWNIHKIFDNTYMTCNKY